MIKSVILEELKCCYTAEEFAANYNADFDTVSDDELESIFNKHCEKYKEVVTIGDLYDNYEDTAFVVNTPDGYQEVGVMFKKGEHPIVTLSTNEYKIRCSDIHLVQTPKGWMKSSDITCEHQLFTKNGYQNVVNHHVSKRPQVVYDFEVLHDNHRYWGGDGVSSHNCGKSYLSCSIARQAQKMGYSILILDSEGNYTSDFCERLGLDINKTMIRAVNTITETSQIITNLCDALMEQDEQYGRHNKFLIILDSIGNLTSTKEADDTRAASGTRDMTKQQQLKQMFRTCTQPLNLTQTPMVCVSHVYAQIGAYVPQNVMAGGNAAIYNSSVILELFASKLQDKDNDDAASKMNNNADVVKTGVLVTARPKKSRYSRGFRCKFQIPYFKSPNPYVGLESWLNWDMAGICRGTMLTDKEWEKLGGDSATVHSWELNGVTYHCQAKDTARGIVVKHLGRAVPLNGLFNKEVFTDEFLHEIDEKIIRPSFELPKQTADDDIEEIENLIEVGENNE